MKINALKTILFLSLTVIFWSCKKTDPVKETVPDKSTIQNESTRQGITTSDNGTGKINLMFYKTYPYVQSVQSYPNKIFKTGKGKITINNTCQVPVTAVVNGYQVGYSCSGGQELNFYDIETSIDGGAVGGSTKNVLVNGSMYTAQFTYSTFTGCYNISHYQLLHVPVSAGYLCNNPTVYFEFYGETETVYQSIATEENTCNVNGSWNPQATSFAAGNLSLALYFTSCNPPCPLSLPANYRFRYRLTTSGTWTEVLVSYPNYYNNYTTVTVAGGDYIVEGRNECAGVAVSPWVPCQFNPIHVN